MSYILEIHRKLHVISQIYTPLFMAVFPLDFGCTENTLIQCAAVTLPTCPFTAGNA